MCRPFGAMRHNTRPFPNAPARESRNRGLALSATGYFCTMLPALLTFVDTSLRMAALHHPIVRCLAFFAIAVIAETTRGEMSEIESIESYETAVEADCPAIEACPELDVWVVSTRRLPGICSLPKDVNFGIERLAGESCSRCWEQATLFELVGEPSRPLVVFVHGNRYSPSDAKQQGLVLARRIASHACGGVAPRVVIFSWPSEQDGLLLKDGRRKYARAYSEGHYLAWLLCQLEPEQPVGIVGYSFGALVTAEALDDLSRTSPSDIPWSERPGRTNLVFVTPALRCDAFAPRGPFRRGIDGVDGVTLVINSQDKPLKFFPLLEPTVRVDAMGLVGMSRRWLPAEIDYSATDAARTVGKLHTLWRYLESGPLSARIAHGSLAGMGD